MQSGVELSVASHPLKQGAGRASCDQTIMLVLMGRED